MSANPMNGALDGATKTGGPGDRARRTRPLSVTAGVASLIGALGLLGIAHGVAVGASDPAGNAPTYGALALVLTSIAIMACAAWGLVTAAQSRRRYVFCGRRSFLCGLGLLVIAAALVTSLVTRDPFREVVTYGQLTASDLVDIGYVLGAVVCLAGAVVAFAAAWAAFDEERNWADDLAGRR